MYNVNDYVIYGATGVCQVTSIEQDSSSGTETLVYTLQPVYHNQSMTVKIPTDRAEGLLRPVLERDEVLAIIDAMPAMETSTLTNQKERSNTFKEAMRTGDIDKWITVIKTLYLEKEARAVDNKKLTKTDEDLLRAAERQLNEEFATALAIEPDDVLPFILSRIEAIEAAANGSAPTHAGE